MKLTLNYEAEPLELDEETSSCGGKCHCAHCQAGGVSREESSEADFETDHEAEFEADFEAAEDFEDSESSFEATGFEGVEEALADEADFESAYGEEAFTEEAFDCSGVPVNCDMSAADADRGLRRGSHGNSVSYVRLRHGDGEYGDQGHHRGH